MSFKTNRMRGFLIIIVATLPIFQLNAQNDKRLQGIEIILNDILDVTKTAGFAVSIVEGDQVLYTKGFGYRDYENKIPVDEHTLFPIGSTTKAFTAAILGQLKNEGKLSFDDNPIKYIPELKFYNNELNNNLIIQDLMSMRTGLGQHDWAWAGIPTDNREVLLKRVQYLEPIAGLRQQWIYSNFSFFIQGVIAEKVTGNSWEDNIRERFFRPLGMDRSNVSFRELKQSSNASLGYKTKNGIISKMDYYDIAAMSPAGGINSCVNDMSKWLLTWVNKGKFQGYEILAESYVDDAMSAHAIVPKDYLADEENTGKSLSCYGYGWILNSYKGHYRVEHGGGIDGFRASVVIFPNENIGIVILTNQSSYEAALMVRNTIADRMLKMEKTDWINQYLENQKKAAESGSSVETSVKPKNYETKPTHPLNEYAGEYSNPGYGQFKVAIQNDSLFTDFRRNKLYLKHVQDDIFNALSIDEQNKFSMPYINFIINALGKISSLKIKFERTLNPIEFKRSN